MFLRYFFILLALAGVPASSLFSQSCVPTGLNGQVFNLNCGTPCTNLTVQVPNLKASIDYVINDITYTPYAYTSLLDVEMPELYSDDEYSSAIPLPFPVCFYGQTYTEAVIGSNGLITFDVSNANCENAYPITNIIPFAHPASSQCDADRQYYPKASIMAAYTDLDPTASESPADRKITWRLEGSAPCRRFVVNFYRMGMYRNSGDCISDPTTFQMVVYEGTGLIDIFFENKTCATETSSNRGISGIQNFERNKALAYPGRNATSWSTSNSAYRFTPSGGATLWQKSDLCKLDGTVLATCISDTATTTAGVLDVRFADFCPVGVPSQYVIKTFYNSCEGPTGSQLLALDTITIQRGGLGATAATTPASCTPSGSITLTVPAGGGTAPFTYVLDGGTPVVQPGFSYTFTGVAAGTHIAIVTDASGCASTLTIVVASTGSVVAGGSRTNATCAGGTEGSITATASGGTGPYQYSLNGGPFGSSGSFTGLSAGTYTVTARDAAGCVSSAVTFIITAPPAITLTAATTPASCSGAADGTITLAAGGGTPGYTYSINGTDYFASNTFLTGSGPRTGYAKDAIGCVQTVVVLVQENSTLASTAVTTPASCNGGADGTITLAASGGTPGYTYSLDGVNFGPSNTFNVAPGTYNLVIRDANGCNRVQPATVGLVNDLTFTPMRDTVACEGGSIVLTPQTNATSFVWTGTPLTPNNTLATSVTVAPVVTTTYALTGTFGRCTYTDNVVVSILPAPVPDAGPDDEICFGQDYTLAAALGFAAYRWSPTRYLTGGIDGPTPTVRRPDATITYSLHVTNAVGCASLVPDAITLRVTPPIQVLISPADTVLYFGETAQLKATSVGTDYVWSPAEGLSDPFIPNPVVTGIRDIIYTVTSTTAAGCSGVGTFKVKVYKGPDIYVPTGFSPNGDGRNDRLRPIAVGIRTLSYFSVYDRWGNAVYRWTGNERGPVVYGIQTSTIGWDGRKGGVLQPMGTYVWIVEGITADGKKVTRKGSVVMMR